MGLGMPLLDARRRPLHDLRISITDRCNFRCVYCMPKEVFGRDFVFLRREQLLTFEEIARLVRLFVTLGVEKVRLTGGEPLLRRDVERLVAMLAAVDGLRDLTLTTNGALLTHEKARSLADAGLKRITISLDSLDDATFRALNDVDFPVSAVLDAIDNAAAAGLDPVKIDVVLKRGVNDHEIVPLAARFRGTPHILRFIEYMDVGNTNRWRLDEVVPGREVRDAIAREWPLEPAESQYFGEVAERWRYVDGGGEIGIITSVTQPFCGTCTRARMSADGELFTCLFASHGHDLRAMLRSDANDDELRERIASVWRVRDDRYSELRAELPAARKVEMSFIGG
jgi:cyclic pyranopterin phosphate synthase